MLAIPPLGMRISTSEHNSDFEVVCDWIEGSVVFATAECSRSDIVDALIEGGIYRSQDFAKELLAIIFGELRRRSKTLPGGLPWKILSNKVVRVCNWHETPGYSFCLLLALLSRYKEWAATFGKNYTEQGELFELLTKESLEAHGWQVLRTGWGGAGRTTIKAVIQSVADWVNEPVLNIKRWSKEDAKESGLDLICHRPYRDGFGGQPTFLVQCASGADWSTKQHTPELELWKKLIDFTTDPIRGFALPFAFFAKSFHRAARSTNGLFLDRYRILAPTKDGHDWISPEVKNRIEEWMKPRVATLPIITK